MTRHTETRCFTYLRHSDTMEGMKDMSDPTVLDIDVCDHCQTIIDMLDDWELAVLGDRIRKQLTAGRQCHEYHD